MPASSSPDQQAAFIPVAVIWKWKAYTTINNSDFAFDPFGYVFALTMALTELRISDMERKKCRLKAQSRLSHPSRMTIAICGSLRCRTVQSSLLCFSWDCARWLAAFQTLATADLPREQ